MSQSKLITNIASVFRPPFKGLAAVVWVYFVICFLVYPDSPILHGILPDTDDYTYLNQTMNWLKGQGWFDNVQYRMSPSEGVPIHFTRIPQLPLAAFIMLFKFLGFQWVAAATITAAVWPLVLLAIFLVSIRWVAEAFMPREWARVTAYVALFADTLMFQFSPGRVDHHGIVAILVFLSLGCIARMIMAPHEVKWGAWTGFLLALAASIAFEALPWVLALSSFMGIWMMIRGTVTARSGFVFGLVLYLSSLLFLIISKSPAHWFDADLLSYSIVYVALMGSVSACFVGVAAAMQVRFAWLRYFVGICLGAALAVLFFSHFPELIAGPYGAVDKELTDKFFDVTGEALPLSAKGMQLYYLISLFIALEVCFRATERTTGNENTLWQLNVFMLMLALALGVYYQNRFLIEAFIFSIIPLAVFIQRGWQFIGENYKGRQKFWAEIGLIMLVGPLPMVIFPAVIRDRPFNEGILLFPADSKADKCEMSILEPILNLPGYYGKQTLNIMNTINDGPELLFRSNHKVMAAPYHTNVKGNKESMSFFETKNPDEAKEIIQRNNIDLVVMCSGARNTYAKKINNNTAVATGGELPQEEGLGQQLNNGRVPKWLKQVTSPLLGNYLLFEVNKKLLKINNRAK